MIQYMDNTTDARDAVPAQLQSLTLSPRGVLVARVPEHTNGSDMADLRTYLKECFPNNRVVVLWKDIDLMTIEDESYIERKHPEHDYY